MLTGPKEPRSTVPSIEDEAVVVAFRRHTLLPLDDCLYALQALPLGDTTFHSPAGPGRDASCPGALARRAPRVSNLHVHEIDRVAHLQHRERLAGLRFHHIEAPQVVEEEVERVPC